MKHHLVVTADLGLLRAYKVVPGVADRQPHLELVEEFRPESAHQKLSEQVTDEAGRFPRGGGASHVVGDLSAGERHSQQLEQTRRLIRLLADKISALLMKDTVEGCWLAVSASVHLRLLDELTPAVRAQIHQTLALDLANADPVELIKHLRPNVAAPRYP